MRPAIRMLNRIGPRKQAFRKGSIADEIRISEDHSLRWLLKALNKRIGLKSSTETETTLVFVDDDVLLNHATSGSGRDMATFPAGPIRLRSARLVRNSANIKHAPIAVTL